MATPTTSQGTSLLDQSDLAFWRENYFNRSYADKSADFDSDYVPAYGYGTEASRKNAITEGSAGGKSFSDVDAELRSGWEQSRGTSRLTYDQARPAIEDAYGRTLRLHEERLRVNKERVQTGEVNLRKEVITEQKQVEVPVEREEVVVTTRPLNEVDGGTIDASETISVGLTAERVNVDKQVVATGEVSLDKKVVQETKTVVDNVRKEVAKVDKTGEVSVTEETATAGR